MKLKKPIKIDQKKFDELNKIQSQLLIHVNHALLAILNLKIETTQVSIKRFFFKPIIINRYKITEIDIWGWHPKGKFWGIVEEKNIAYYIHMFNFVEMRERYDNLLQSLEEIDKEVAKKPIPFYLQHDDFVSNID